MNLNSGTVQLSTVEHFLNIICVSNILLDSYKLVYNIFWIDLIKNTE